LQKLINILTRCSLYKFLNKIYIFYHFCNKKINEIDFYHLHYHIYFHQIFIIFLKFLKFKKSDLYSHQYAKQLFTSRKMINQYFLMQIMQNWMI